MADMLGKLKKFVQKKKLDTKFKKAGAGHSLSEQQRRQQQQAQRAPVQPAAVSEAQRAANAERLAAAVDQRLASQTTSDTNRSRAAIREEARRQIEAMQSQSGSASSGSAASSAVGSGMRQADERRAQQAPALAVSGVYFTCELLGDDVVMTKPDLIAAVRELLDAQMEEDALTASCIMLQSMTSNREKREVAVQTITKIVDNIMANPTEPKYRKIRMGNAAIKEKVLAVQGGAEFLRAIGFAQHTLPGPNGDEEPFLVMADHVDAGGLAEAKEALNTAVAVPLRLHHNPRVIRPSQKVDFNARLPEDFFDVSADEVKRLQDDMSNQVDQLLSLRTREMRERDAMLSRVKYKYTLIRVKFPDGYILEGTFATLCQFSTLRQFVDERLEHCGLPFALKDTASGVALSCADDERSLSQLKLVPAAMLHFEWPADVLAGWKRAGAPARYLSERWVGVPTE